MQLEDVGQFKRLVDSERGRFFAVEGSIFVARAPGRLDVMGGIADYSGSLVLEMPIAEATLAAVQLDEEPTVRIVSLGGERVGETAVFTLPLANLLTNNEPISYETAVAYFRQRQPWAAYIAGAILVLMREKGLGFKQGARLLLHSDVPEGKGVSSSAAVEVAAMQAITAAYGIELTPRELALLCQKVENHVAGAPCGIMDQMTVVAGQPNQLLALLCQPAEIQGTVPIPAELSFVGLDSGIRHAVSGADYVSVRVGAFIGYKLLQTAVSHTWDGYLANLHPSEFEQHYRHLLPETMRGDDFLRQYGELPDTVTQVDPVRTYAVRQPTLHPIYEHFRVQTFARLLAGDPLANAPMMGELMYQSHASYSACGLGSDGTDLLVALARATPGVHGAKITGGGSGGTVVVLGETAVIAQATTHIAQQYAAQTGHTPHIFTGSSPGTAQFGTLRF
ncbi:MAG: GHMP kinase [Ardenticatenaceae bacterium]|nr:GHMP kinase [Ardenticatenaceae bacterium]